VPSYACNVRSPDIRAHRARGQPAGLASQQEVGLLPHRRYKHGNSNYPGSILDRSFVAGLFLSPFSTLNRQLSIRIPDIQMSCKSVEGSDACIANRRARGECD